MTQVFPPEAQPYADAIEKLKSHYVRNADGTFTLNHDGTGIDPVVFDHLVRSLEHTNEMLRQGIIKSEDIPTYENGQWVGGKTYEVPNFAEILEKFMNGVPLEDLRKEYGEQCDVIFDEGSEE